MKRTMNIVCLLLCATLMSSCTGKYVYNGTSTYDNSDYTRESAGIRLEDDFYGYVNFDFLWSNNISVGESEYSYRTIISTEADSFLSSKILEIADVKAKLTFGSDEQKIHDFYCMYLDESARNTAELSSLSDGINAIEQADNINEFMSVCGMLYSKYGCEVLCVPTVSVDYIKSDKYSLYLKQMDLIYPAEDLLSTVGCAEDEQKLIAAVLEACGYCDCDTKAYDVMTMLLEIAENTSEFENMSVPDIYNLLSPSKLKTLFSNADINGYLSLCGTEKDVPIIVYDVNQVETINRYLTDNMLSVWKNYAVCRLIYDYSDYLPSEYRELFMPYSKNVVEDAVNAVKKELSDELGNIYAKEYCDKETIKKATELAETVKDDYRDAILASDLIDDNEKQGLLKKLENINFIIGYPSESCHNDSVISGGLLDSCISIRESKILHNFSLYGTSVSDSLFSPYTFNAFYSKLSNSITVPYILLNKPFFDADADFYTNLGGLGTVIAHEMTHAFDGDGITFDENGCYNPTWIGTGNNSRIEDLRKQTEEYFGNKSILNTFLVNGKLTANENLADIGAVYVVSRTTDDAEQLKKIYDNYAVCWAVLSYDDDAAESLCDDVHSPAEIRVNAVLSSIDSFYTAYAISEKDGMYTSPKKRIRIW